MFRPLMMMGVLLTASVAAAAQAQGTGGPPIAYVKVAGNAYEIYLVNQDGSGLRKVYSVKGKSIGSLDMKPGGNQLAFVQRSSGSLPVLLILNYTDETVSKPVSVPGICGPDYVDYNPVASDPPKLLVSGSCGAGNGYIASVHTDGSGYTVLQTGSADLYASQARWLSDGLGYVWVRSVVGGSQQLCRNACNPANGELLWSGYQVAWMDVGRTDNTILFNSGSYFVHKLNGDTGVMIQENYIRGDNAHFSPTHRYVLYRSPHSASGDYLHILDNNTNLAPRLTGKGTYGPADWRK